MKYLIILLFPLSLLAQDKVMRVHKNTSDSLILVKYPQSIVIPVSDAMTYKWVLPDFDTARFFEASEALEATVTFKRIGTTPTEPVVEKVDAEAATFGTGWTHGPTSASGWYQNTIAYSSTPAATVTYSFTGTGIEVWAETKNNHGTGTVTLLKGTEVIETKPTNFVTPETILPAKIYEKKGLPAGTYTLRLTVGTGYSLLDYFIVEK